MFLSCTGDGSWLGHSLVRKQICYCNSAQRVGNSRNMFQDGLHYMGSLLRGGSYANPGKILVPVLSFFFSCYGTWLLMMPLLPGRSWALKKLGPSLKLLDIRLPQSTNLRGRGTCWGRRERRNSKRWEEEENGKRKGQGNGEGPGREGWDELLGLRLS